MDSENLWYRCIQYFSLHQCTKWMWKHSFYQTLLYIICLLIIWFLSGLSFQDFYQRCREAFLVNSDLTLRTQLTEFRDHKLIRTRKVGLQYLASSYCTNASFSLAAHNAVFLPLTVVLLTQNVELLFLPALFVLDCKIVPHCSIVTDFIIIVPHCNICPWLQCCHWIQYYYSSLQFLSMTALIFWFRVLMELNTWMFPWIPAPCWTSLRKRRVTDDLILSLASY